MKRLLSTLVLNLFFHLSTDASVPHFAEQRQRKVAALDVMEEFGKNLLLPDQSSCAPQVQSAGSLPTLPNGAVFSFRVPIALTHSVASDTRIPIAFELLLSLSDLLRTTPGGDTYVLPNQSDRSLKAHEVYAQELSPHHLSYAARAYAPFAGDPTARRKMLALWNTLHNHYEGPKGGFLAGWNPKTGATSNRITQASLIYPWSSSGFKLLAALDPKTEGMMLAHHLVSLRSSTEAALAFLREGKLPVEQVDAATLTPLTEGTYGQQKPVVILGHYAQILNFLLRSHQASGQGGKALLETVREQFRFLLGGTFINSQVRGLGNGYYQDTGLPVEGWGTNMAFWQQTELIAALDRAIKMGIFDKEDALLETAQRTLLQTLDLLPLYYDFRASTPRAAVLSAQGDPLSEDSEWMAYILPYHMADLIEQLREGN